MFDTITDYVHFYDYDFDELDRKYGKGRYEIVDFECYKELRETRPHNYAFCTYTPVIVVKDDAGGVRIVSLGKKDNFYPGFFASASLVGSVFYKRFALAVPLYRLEQEYKARNVLLTRQTLVNWILKFALERFGPVYDRMARELGERCRIQQCDETTWRVIIWPEEEDGTRKKPNGSKGYVWVHTSSELGDGRKTIQYSFEKTRSADHLRVFLSDLVTWLVSDAYSGYIAMEKERGGALGVANCWMHCGAESNAIVYSIVETAKANGADVYTYLKYLLTEVPKYLDGSDTGFLADMMPWSPVYKAYERQAMLDHADERMPESNNPPPGMGKAPTCKCGAA